MLHTVLGRTPLKCRHEDAVMWNPYNRVVQCHRCGWVFVLQRYGLRVRLHNTFVALIDVLRWGTT